MPPPVNQSMSIYRILLGGALSRAPLGIWFCWLCLNGAVLKRYRSEVDSLRAIHKFIGVMLIFFALSLSPVMSLQRLLGPRWSCFLGTIFIMIGLLASAVGANIWQFFVGAGLVVSIGSSMLLTPPLCLGFRHHPTQKGLVVGVINAGMIIGVFVGMLLSITLLPEWMEYGEVSVEDSNEPSCGGLPWRNASICINVSITMSMMGLVLGVFGSLGAFILPEAKRALLEKKTVNRVNFHSVDQRRGHTRLEQLAEIEPMDEINEMLSQGSRESGLSDRVSFRASDGRVDLGSGDAAITDWDAASLLSHDEGRTTFHTTLSHQTYQTQQTQRTQRLPPLLDSLPEAHEPLPVKEIYEESVPWLICAGFCLTSFPSLVLLFSWSPSFDDGPTHVSGDDETDFLFSLYSSALTGKLLLVVIALLSCPLWGYLFDTVIPILVKWRAGGEALVHLGLGLVSTALVMAYKSSRSTEDVTAFFILNSFAACCVGGSITLWPALLAELYPSSILSSLGFLYTTVLFLTTTGLGLFFWHPNAGQEVSTGQVEGLVVVAIAGVAACATVLVSGISAADMKARANASD